MLRAGVLPAREDEVVHVGLYFAFVGVLGSAFVASDLGVPLRDCPPRWPAAGAPPLCRCVKHPNHCQRLQPGHWQGKVLSIVRQHDWG